MVGIKNIQTFLSTVHRFPPELSKNPKYMAVARKIKAHMRKENSSKLWRSELDFIYAELNMVFDLIVYNKFIKQNPNLAKVKEESYTPEDWAKLLRIKEDIRTGIIDAKLKGSKEWKLVEKTFTNVRDKMLTVIDETSLSKDTKEKMKTQLQEVELSLPYSDPELLGVDYGCSQDSYQATYYYYRKKITVCGGYFYGYQSEATLSSVMAHELGHSIDLNQRSIDAFRRTPTGQAQAELLQMEGPIRSCKTWNDLKAQGIWGETKSKLPAADELFEKFKSCLRGKSDLKPMTIDALSEATQLSTGHEISALAKNYNYSFLATTEIYKEGKIIPNPFYLRPDLKLWANSNYSNTYRMSDGAPIQHFFIYNLICEDDKDEPRDLAKLSVEERNSIFSEAIKKTKKMTLSHISRLFEICGDECSGLINFNLAKPTAENYADWISTKTMTKIIEQLEAPKRMDYAREAGAILCERPESHFDHELMIQEKKFSRETHGNNRVRRWSMISPETAKILECSLDKKQSLEFAECRL